MPLDNNCSNNIRVFDNQNNTGGTSPRQVSDGSKTCGAKGWKYQDWKKYFTYANKSTDLSFAGENFHFFAVDHSQAALNLLKTLKVNQFNVHGKHIIRALQENVRNGRYEAVSIAKEVERTVTRNTRPASPANSLTDSDMKALFWIEFFKESDPNKDLKDFKNFAEENPFLAERIIAQNIFRISKKFGSSQAASLCRLFTEYGNSNLFNSDSHDNKEYHRLLEIYNREAIDKSENWNFHQWESFFLDPHRPPKGVKIIKNFATFARANQFEARSIIDSLNNTHHLTRPEKLTLNKIKRSMPSIAKSASNRDTDTVKSLHATQALAPAAPPSQNKVEDLANKLINNTNIQIRPQPTNTDSHTISVEEPAQDTSSWDKSKWEDYLSQLSTVDGTNTLRTFVTFAQANPESASELLENQQNGNLSGEQAAVMRILRERFLKSSISSEKLTGAQVLAQNSQIKPNQTPLYASVVVSTAQVPTTEKGWHDYFIKLDKTYPDELFKKDMDAFGLFALRDKSAAARAAVAIYEKGKRDDNDIQVIEISRALGVINLEKNPNIVDNPKRSVVPAPADLSPLINKEPVIIPNETLSTKVQEPQQSKTSSNPQEPESGLDTEEEVISSPIEEPKIKPTSAFDETTKNLVGDLSVALKLARTQALDIEDDSPFAAAKLIAIETMLKESRSELINLTKALKTLDGKALTYTDKYQLRAIANDFYYFDDAKINDLKAIAQKNLEAANKKKLDATNTNQEAVTKIKEGTKAAALSPSPTEEISLPKQTAISVEAVTEIKEGTNAAALSPSPKEEKSLPEKTTFEIIKGLEDDLKEASKNFMNLDETDIRNIETQLNETFKDLADLAKNDKFFQSANDDNAKVFWLSKYILLLINISKENTIAKIFEDEDKAEEVRLQLQEYSKIINQSLLEKIEAIKHPDETIIGFLKTALKFDFQFKPDNQSPSQL